MNTKDDSELVAMSRQGDLWAFGELFTKYHSRLLKHVIKMFPSRADAEDVVQETFLNAFRAISNFRGESCFFSWLYKIALNCAFSSMRKNERRVSACSLSDRTEDEWERIDAGLASFPSPMDKFQAKQLIKSIDVQLNSMPIIFAEALIYREVYGFSYDQISRSMQCSVGTVRSRLFRARQIIHEALGEQ